MTAELPSLQQIKHAIDRMNLVDLEAVVSRLGSIAYALDKCGVSHIGEACEHLDAAADLIHQARRVGDEVLTQEGRDAAEEARADALRDEA